MNLSFDLLGNVNEYKIVSKQNRIFIITFVLNSALSKYQLDSGNRAFVFLSLV